MPKAIVCLLQESKAHYASKIAETREKKYKELIKKVLILVFTFSQVQDFDKENPVQVEVDDKSNNSQQE